VNLTEPSTNPEENLPSRLARRLLNDAPDMVLIVDGEARIRFVNEACREMVGYEPADLVGQPLAMLVPAQDRTDHEQHLRRYQELPTVRAMGPPGLNTRAHHRAGHEVPVDIKLSPLSENGGRLTLAIVRDATLRKEYEEQLKSQAHEMARLNQEKNRFLGLITHDLRNPLTVIRGYVDILIGERLGSLDDKQMDALTYVRDAAQHMLFLAEEILDLTAVEEATLHLVVSQYSLNKVLERALVLQEVLATQKNQRIVLKPAQGDPQVMLDPQRITQALNNLVSNAIKYSPPDTDIIVEPVRNGDRFEVRVMDQGPGVPPEAREQIFLPFGTAGTPTTAGERSIGLGLVIVRKIAEAHHGAVWVDDKYRMGACFVLALPAVPATWTSDTAF
jgi:PAS domain S-box-containing protein